MPAVAKCWRMAILRSDYREPSSCCWALFQQWPDDRRSIPRVVDALMELDSGCSLGPSWDSAMSTAEELRDKAEQCMRIARATSNKTAAESLMAMAADYLEQAVAAAPPTYGAHQPPQQQ